MFVWSPIAAAVTAVAGVDRVDAPAAVDGDADGMSFHPNDVIRRGRAASLIVSGVVAVSARRVLPRAGDSQRGVAAAVGGEPAAPDSDRRAARTHPRPQQPADRRERRRLFGGVARVVGGHAARDARPAQEHDPAHAQAVPGCDSPLSSGVEPPDGDRAGRVVRRRVGARGAPHGFPEPDHSVRAEADLSRRRRRSARSSATSARSTSTSWRA